MDSKTKQYINKEADKTKYKGLFMSLMYNSETCFKQVKRFFCNGLYLKAYPTENTILNKLQMEV